MKFEPAPRNDFLVFARAYYQRCRSRVPRISAVAAKWSFEDLIPGLSDFDARFIVADPMTADDWRNMALAVGRVHVEMAGEFPRWLRNLEHLPGVNLTIGEISDPRLFCPEFQQWTFYDGDKELIRRIETDLAAVTWSSRDELYNLKRFASFCGPYQRGIDPPVNIGPWENKYPLHSRYMHYFCAPVQAAVSLILRRNVRGKLESLRLARELLPNRNIIDRLFDTLARHYETPSDYQRPRLTELERELESYLGDAWGALAGQVALLDPRRGDSPRAIRAKVAAAPADPIAAFFESTKFARLLEGRLLFYSEAVPNFDSAWLIRNEIGRIVTLFFDCPLALYARATGIGELEPRQVLDELNGGLLSPAECDGMRQFASIASEPIAAGAERAAARRVAAAFRVVPVVIEKLSAELLDLQPSALKQAS